MLVKPNGTLLCEHMNTWGISILTNNNYAYNDNTATAIRKHIDNCNHLSSIVPNH